MASLTQAGDGLEPAEDFFDPFTLLLTDRVAGIVLNSATYTNRNQVATWNGVSASSGNADNLATDPSNGATYTYDERNQLNTVSSPAYSFSYDAFGRRESFELEISSAPKLKRSRSSKRTSLSSSNLIKFTVNMDDYQVHVFVLKLMDGIKVMTRTELEQRRTKVDRERNALVGRLRLSPAIRGSNFPLANKLILMQIWHSVQNRNPVCSGFYSLLGFAWRKLPCHKILKVSTPQGQRSLPLPNRGRVWPFWVGESQAWCSLANWLAPIGSLSNL